MSYSPPKSIAYRSSNIMWR